MIIGILGGGQLAMMLAEAAIRLKMQTRILAETADEPAKYTASEYQIGSLKDISTLTRFFEGCDVITIESEFVDSKVIEEAQIQSKNRPHIIPNTTAIRVSQDKLSQKELFNRLHLPTSRHRQVFELKDLGEILQDFPGGCVLKWAKFGYDGKGNFFFRKPSQIQEAEDFCNVAFKKGVRVYAESYVHFEHELAMIYVRSRGGDFVTYPLVSSLQEHGVCRVIQGPATRLGIAPKLEAQAASFGRAIGDYLQLGGIFALEFFYSQSTGLIINEMAPRVHNSGHYSQDACSISQFENHLRAITGTKILSPETASFFAMYNILGPFGSKPVLVEGRPRLRSEALRLHWYEKRESRSGRKMGHINCTSDSPHGLQAAIIEMKEVEEEWLKGLEEQKSQS